MQSDIYSINDHIAACLEEVHPLVSRYSRPLFGVDTSDRPDLFASCVIIEYEGAPYLTTAAHALHEIAMYGSSVHMGAKEIRAIEGSAIRSSTDGSDPLDIAAVMLDSDVVASLGLVALPSKKTMVGKTFDRPHMHCMHGYPCTKNKKNKAANTERKVFNTYAFTYASTTPVNVNFQKYKKSPTDHLCLCYGTGIDGHGSKVKPPKPKGMSGGGLWVVPNSFKGGEMYLAGILIEQHGDMVFATKIERVIELIQRRA